MILIEINENTVELISKAREKWEKEGAAWQDATQVINHALRKYVGELY